jgi:hypothetical protein
MPRKCTVCSYEQCAVIDKAIIAGESNRSIAKRHPGISESAIQRHRAHIKKAIAKAGEKREITNGKSAIQQFEEMLAEAERMYRGTPADSVLTKATWFREWRGMMELGFKLGMEAQRQKQIYQDVTPAVLKMIEEAMG